MRKIAFFVLSVVSYNCISDNYYVRAYAKGVGESNKEYSSCNNILESNKSTGDGVYEITNNNKIYNVYCDMSSYGGGWTLVLAQYESSPTESWDEGIQGDYDPSLSSRKSFSLNQDEIPNHSYFSMSQENYDGVSLSDIGYFEYTYSTGNLELEEISSSNGSYQIHRNKSYHYGNHNPESVITNSIVSNDTLTIDKMGGQKLSYAFSINETDEAHRGYSYKGRRGSTNESGAWLLWVK